MHEPWRLATFPDYCINYYIDQQNKQGEQVLNILCQACGVDQRRKVVFDKSAFSGAGYDIVAKLILERGQWAGPAKYLDQDSPCHTREVQPCEPVKPQYQQTTCDNE